MIRKRTGIVLAVTVLITLFICPPLYAEGASDDGGWDWFLAPLYLWAIDLSGTQSVGPATMPIDYEFADLFDNIETMFTVHFEGVKDQKWGFILDLSYIDVQTQQVQEPGTIDFGLKNPIYELDVFLRLGENRHFFDLLAGIRYNEVQNDIKMVGMPVHPVIPSEFDLKFDWVDGLLGARWIWDFTEKWNFALRGDIAAGGSDLTWNTSAIVQWQPWKVVGFLAGYRVMDIDYEEGTGLDRIVYDVRYAGPLLAVTFVW